MNEPYALSYPVDTVCWTDGFVRTLPRERYEPQIRTIKSVGVDALMLTGYVTVEPADFDMDEEEIMVGGPFEANGDIQKYLEDNGYEIKSSELVYEPAEYKELTDEQRADVEALIEVLEEDDDVQNVYTNMQPGADDEE